MSQTNTLVRAGMTPAERCRYVADLIEQHPENFDMSYFAEAADGGWEPEQRLARGGRLNLAGEDCGTKCCMAGWAVAVTPADEVAALTVRRSRPTEIIAVAARVLLGLDDEWIFYGPSMPVETAAFLLRWHADELDRA